MALTLAQTVLAFEAAATAAGFVVAPSLGQASHRGVYVEMPDEDGTAIPGEGDLMFVVDTVRLTLHYHLAAGNVTPHAGRALALEAEQELRDAIVASAGLISIRPRFLRATRGTMPGQAEWHRAVLDYSTLREVDQ